MEFVYVCKKFLRNFLGGCSQGVIEKEGLELKGTEMERENENEMWGADRLMDGSAVLREEKK